MLKKLIKNSLSAIAVLQSNQSSSNNSNQQAAFVPSSISPATSSTSSTKFKPSAETLAKIETSIQTNLANILHKQKFSQIQVAFSGGADSLILLIFANMFAKKHGLAIKALHINHGINPKSSDWSDFCKKICDDLAIEFQSFKLNLTNSGDFETQARIARYEVFAKMLTKNQVLLMGHHKDDQIETLLLNTFRGTGNLGIASMPKIRKFAQGFLARPLLDTSKQEIYFYLQSKHQTWIEDESNQDSEILRNFIRLEVLPLLRTRYTNLDEKLHLTCNNAQATQELLDEIAVTDFNYVSFKHTSGISEQNSNASDNLVANISKLDIAKLQALSFERQKNLMRFVVKIQKLENLPQGFFYQLQNFLQKPKASGTLQWGQNSELRIFKNLIFIGEKINFTPLTNLNLKWDGKQASMQQILTEYKINLTWNLNLPVGDYKIKSRDESQGAKIFHKGKHRSVKKLLQAANIPPWQRDRQVFIWHKNQLLAVGNLLQADFFQNPNGA